MPNNNKSKKTKLENNAKQEIQKTQQISESLLVKEHLLDRQNNKLKNNIILRDKIEKMLELPSEKLLGKIEGKQIFLDDLQIEIASNTTELNGSNDKARQAIAELRKVDPKRANELENSLSLKIEAKKTRTIVKKRL